MVFFASEDLPQNSPHDLAASCLGQIWDDKDGLGRREGPNALPDLQDEILLQEFVDLIALLDRNEGVDRLSGQFIADSNDGSLSHSLVLDQGGFDLGGGQAVSTDVDNIVNTASDPVVAFVITSSSVTGELPIISTENPKMRSGKIGLT